MVKYHPGLEPESLKKRIRTLFDKLDAAYPDKNIVGLHKDHKKWGETVTELYRELGYPDGKSFLEAYGYKYVTRDYAKGRPKSVDPEAIIKALQKKYPNGSPFRNADELFEANPEYLPKLKTIKNTSNEIFGMSLGKYLFLIGMLQSKSTPKPEKKKSYTICKMRPTGAEESFYYISTTNNIHEGDYAEFPMGLCDCLVFGTVEEIITCDEDSSPCDVEKVKMISRKVGVREYNARILSSILHTYAVVTTDDLIENASISTFKGTNPANPKCDGYIPWACVRGMSTEVMKVLDYLIQKDNQIYSYNDLILTDPGVSELYVYTDDAKDVLEKYPDVKMVMFAENKQANTVALYYSKSGFSVVTDSYDIGSCNLKSKSKWTVKHSPVDDFKDGNVSHTFKFNDDWNAVNYVFTDEHSNRKQLGK